MTVAPSLDALVESLAGDLSSIRAPRGTTLNARSWLTEAPLRMLLNNLDREVAERPEELDRKRALAIREHLPRLQAGGVPHRDVILLPRARRNRVDRRGMGEHLVLGDEGRGHVLRDHEAAVQSTVGREERRQAVGEVRVDEALDPPLRDVDRKSTRLNSSHL